MSLLQQLLLLLFLYGFRSLLFATCKCKNDFINFVAVPRPPQADCPADIIFVVDDSRSIGAGNFDRVKSFLRQLVGRLDIDSGRTKVGLVTFSSSVGTVINLREHSTVSSLQLAISSLRYTGGGTDTARALAYVRTTMLTSAAGDRSNVPNIVAVLTDGISVDSRATVVSFHLSLKKQVLWFFYLFYFPTDRTFDKN